ncbi:MAG: DUF3568 family protein [bacterium]
MKNACRWIGALLILACAAGCSTRQVLTTLGLGVAAGAGAATVYYVKGDLEYDLAHNVNDVYWATLTTMEKRDYSVTTKNFNDATGRIEAVIPAKGGDKEHDLTIKLERKEENLTHISIRVGVFGDESLSRAILDDIQSKL